MQRINLRKLVKKTDGTCLHLKNYNNRTNVHKSNPGQFKTQCISQAVDHEAISYHNERNLSDPGIVHTLVLATDDFGNT